MKTIHIHLNAKVKDSRADEFVSWAVAKKYPKDLAQKIYKEVLVHIKSLKDKAKPDSAWGRATNEQIEKDAFNGAKQEIQSNQYSKYQSKDGGPGSGPQEGAGNAEHHSAEVSRVNSQAKEESKKFDSSNKEDRVIAVKKIQQLARAQELHNRAIIAHKEYQKNPNSTIKKEQFEKASQAAVEYTKSNKL